jgi:hypothetical protein
MKKSLFLLLLLVGFSAFAINTKHNSKAKPKARTAAKAVRHSATPLADFLLFPSLDN